MNTENNKPVIGITCGDINGIGLELIIKTFTDQRLLNLCTPVIFAQNNCLNYYIKLLGLSFNFIICRDLNKIHYGQINLVNCWEKNILIKPGELNEDGGYCALESLNLAIKAQKNQQIDLLVTAPINKSNVAPLTNNFSGHTQFLKAEYKVKEVLMILYNELTRMALVTEHIAVKDIKDHLSKEKIINSLAVFIESIKKDFLIEFPKIAVLSLNPHNGDSGLIGAEESEIIIPAIKHFTAGGLVKGPFAADSFFGKGQYSFFDGVLAMYHDQGLIGIKTLSTESPVVNFTAGLPFIRTSPDHGPAFDIAGKKQADHTSFMNAIFEGLQLYKNRQIYNDMSKNPMAKLSRKIVPNKDE